MFIAGGDTGAVYKYKLETGFDVSTAYFVDSISVSAQDSSPSEVVFNNDGSKMYIVGQPETSLPIRHRPSIPNRLPISTHHSLYRLYLLDRHQLNDC
jgi:hypothetical protein